MTRLDFDFILLAKRSQIPLWSIIILTLFLVFIATSGRVTRLLGDTEIGVMPIERKSIRITKLPIVIFEEIGILISLNSFHWNHVYKRGPDAPPIRILVSIPYMPTNVSFLNVILPRLE